MAVVPINYLHLRNDDLHETGKTLGRGAYGEVVEMVYLGTPCAAKRIHPILEESGGRLKEGFRRECETWSRLRHPNVVQLLGLLYKPSASSKLPMIVMEKMDCSLRQFVETNKRETIPLYVKADILHQVAQGLVYLHGQRPPVVHRDLSPNNILINLGSMTAKLSDFGVAKFQIHQASRMTSLPGTPTFMPPETLPGAQPPAKGYNDRIDVFSYGGVVICTVTHEWPEPLPPNAMKGGKLVALNEIERRQRYLDLFTAEEKTCFLGLVELCLEYDPVDRPTSQEMMATLQEVKGAHPSQSYVHLLENLETVTESNRETAKLLQKKTEDMENLQRESSGMQERIKMLQDENSRLSSECDAALANLRESEENVFDLQQAIEVLNTRREQAAGGSQGKDQPTDDPRPKEKDSKVELRKAVVAWKRTAQVAKEQTEEEQETQELYRKFQGILNKLTPQKFQKLAEQAKDLMSTAATTQERMSGCIEKFYNQAVKQPLYIVAYAELSLVLAGYKIKVDVNEDGTPKMKSFRDLLVARCQEEFEKGMSDNEELDKLQKAMEDALTDEERKQQKEVFEEAEFKARHRSLGNIRFIGELFKLKLLSEAIMHECSLRLLRSSSDGESLECFAKLMSTIGKEMDHSKVKNLMEKYFNRVSHVIEAKKVDSRVRFLLQDLVDLRQNAWVPRKLAATNVPTTIDKIHKQAKKEEMEMQKRIASQPMMGRPRGGVPTPSSRIDAEKFSPVLNRVAGPTQPTRLGPPPGGGGKNQAARAQSAVQAQVIPPPQQPQQQQQHRQFNSAPQMNPNLMFSQPHVFYQAGAGLMHQGQPMLHPTYPTMFHPQMVLGAGVPPRQQVMMFPHQQFPPPGHVPAMAYGGARHDLPAAQAPNQKYHQQPQQPSTQLQPKTQSTTKRATKALRLVDPDTNKPLDLVGVSGSSKSKSPEPASVTSLTHDARSVEFMEKISRTSAITDASAPEPSPSTQQGEAAQQLSEGALAKDNSVRPTAQEAGSTPPVGETVVQKSMTTDEVMGKPVIKAEVVVEPEELSESKVQNDWELKQPEVELAPADETSSTDVAVTKEPSTEAVDDLALQVQEREQLDEWVILESAQANSVEPGEVEKVDVGKASVCKVDELKEKEVPEMKTKTAAEQSKIGEEEACASEGHLALTAGKVDANKVEEKRGQLPLKTEEEKEEGEITSDDEPPENVNAGGQQEAGGRKKYNREHLLSFRFLKECLEPPENLFFPGAFELVRKTDGYH